MPWERTEPMNEKMKFVATYLDKQFDSFQSLCERFNISRKTGYQIVNRYKKEGPKGLEERSRAPRQHGGRMAPNIESSILALKEKRPRWGAKKVLNYLKQECPSQVWPAKSTIDDLFKRHGLVRPARRKRRVAPYTEPFALCTQANDSWSIDYKGQFRLKNGEYCYPLTVTDNFSRYILAISGSSRISGHNTKATLERLFFEHGLPTAIRSDNGAPFAGTGLAGLSRVNVWIIKQGIIPERIRTGHPEENGRHERMHLTLKQETAQPSQRTQAEQQKSFDVFRQMFNEERPHEGIDFNRPAYLYAASDRQYTGQARLVEYDGSFQHKRKVKSNGMMKWKGKEIFISETLEAETIALKPYSEDEWLIYFSFMPIGVFNERMQKVIRI